MNAPRATLSFAAVVLAALVSCGRHGDDDDDEPKAELKPFAAAGSPPPVVLTFNVAFAENVTLPAMQALASKIETANESLWNASEAQIRIGRIRVSDNAHPGSTSDQYNQLNLTAHDIVVWSPMNFNGPGIAYVLVGSGQFGRFMGIPSNIANTTFLHELGHFMFDLSWSVAPVLIDEYDEPPTDTACMMELTYTPLRWCAGADHLPQDGQPHSCWTQILADYPSFSYRNLDVAPSAPPPPIVEFNDIP